MASKAAPYRCSECGHAALAWTGQCPGCGAWNTLEQASSPSPGRRGGGGAGRGRAPKPVALRDVKAERSERLSTGIAELDRVLGGGLVPGSLVLLGGAPGIGKSTLAGMALANLARLGRGHALRLRRGVGRPGAPAGRASRRCRAVRADARRAVARERAGGARGRAAGRVRDRLRPDARGPGHCARQRRRRARGHLGAARHRQATRRHPDSDRARDQGGLTGRAPRPRAPGRLRPSLRGRAGADVPHAARPQESLRRDQRGGRIRDAPGRARRGRRPLGALRRRGAARRRARSCSARWRGPGRCWSRCRRW